VFHLCSIRGKTLEIDIMPKPADASPWAAQWQLRTDTIYLNHGSFGPPPEPVLAARREWQRRLDEQPMDFYVRQLTPAWLDARAKLAEFVGTAADNLVFLENATAGMNVVADSFALAPGDEVLLTDHEYGAVLRIWQRACRRAGATAPKVVALPRPFETPEEVVDTIARAVTPQTKMVIVSHITSPTAVILPVAAICRAVRAHGAAVCIDGPHAPAQVPVAIDEIGCDYYCASLHKWLSAPFGSGFLYVAPPRQNGIEPINKSWGVLQPAQPAKWFEEFIWPGTRDPSPYLSVPAALDFFHAVGARNFRARLHDLARYARARLVDVLGTTPLVPDDAAWYGSMAHVPLPAGFPDDLQAQLWRKHGIEAPIMTWGGERYVRVSCHLYTTTTHIDRLVQALVP
jgi:isopenicillin-N epimerase